ncbi:GH32 C-terminal domain-containing protein, partial [Hydrogenibacillus schlegelii]|uniref:GH32 C-terminal domain-containing protein n=1 Tax=Hydrogenibacillus schlegelii TaxID=1484 RepID=UPI002354D9F7
EVNEAADGAAVAVTRGDRLEIDLTFDVARSTAHRFGIDVRASSNRRERTRLLYDRRARRFRFDRSRSGIVGGVREVSLSAERLRLHLFIDRSSVELFVNDGERSFTARVYPDPGSDGVLIFAEGGAVVVESMRVWRLKNIWAGMLH